MPALSYASHPVPFFIFTVGMVPYKDCQFCVVYFPCDETFDIVKLDDTSFQESDYNTLVKNSSAEIGIECSYNGKKYDGIVIQVGKAVEDLEVTEERCVSLMKEKKKKIHNILIRIPKFHSGRRMAYEPLGVINTSASDTEMTPRKAKNTSNKEPKNTSTKSLSSITELPPMEPYATSSQSDLCSQSTSVGQSNHSEQGSVANSVHIQTPSGPIISNIKDKPFLLYVVEKLNRLTAAMNTCLENNKLLACKLDALISMQGEPVVSDATPKFSTKFPITDIGRLKEFINELKEDNTKRSSLVGSLMHIFNVIFNYSEIIF